MTDYAAVLTREYPGREWSLNGNDYASLTVHDDGPKPTKKTLDDKWPKVQYDQELESVQQARHARYVAESDPLFFKAQRDDDGVTLDDWKAAVAQIKADLPEPTPPGA
jgi:hypothetical protein